MPNKIRMLKKAFHGACRKAIAQQLGQEWTEYQTGDESWNATFQRASKNCINVLRLRLVQNHLVTLELAVKSNPRGPMPRIGWEDRHLHPQASGYFKLLWHGDLRYGREESINVPKEFWHPEFQAAIEESIRDLRGRMKAWFATAEAHIKGVSEQP